MAKKWRTKGRESHETVFEMLRPTQIYEWGHPRPDGMVQIVGRIWTKLDSEGHPHAWLSVYCYFEADRYDPEPYVKRYPRDDLESYKRDLGNLPSIVLIEEMERRGFRLE